jgi:hypothetical protein
VRGNISEFPLESLLQGLMTAKKSGALHIETPIPGRIYLKMGALIHAEIGDLRGMEAIELVAGIKAAQFHFEAEEQVQPQTIDSSLETQYSITQQFEQWKHIQLPTDWATVLKAKKTQQKAQLTPMEIALFAAAENRSLMDTLVSRSSPIEAAKMLDKLIQMGLLEPKAQINTSAVQLVVLSLYGNDQGIAALDDQLYAGWSRLAGGSFLVRVRNKGVETLLRAQPRPNLNGRVGLFERDMRQMRVARGSSVEVTPEIP